MLGGDRDVSVNDRGSQKVTLFKTRRIIHPENETQNSQVDTQVQAIWLEEFDRPNTFQT